MGKGKRGVHRKKREKVINKVGSKIMGEEWKENIEEEDHTKEDPSFPE